MRAAGKVLAEEEALGMQKRKGPTERDVLGRTDGPARAGSDCGREDTVPPRGGARAVGMRVAGRPAPGEGARSPRGLEEGIGFGFT